MRVVIHPSQREAFAKRLASLNKKCVRFGLGDGIQFIWNTSSSLDQFKGREGCKCKATVKRHSRFKEQWQTELLRAKLALS